MKHFWMKPSPVGQADVCNYFKHGSQVIKMWIHLLVNDIFKTENNTKFIEFPVAQLEHIWHTINFWWLHISMDTNTNKFNTLYEWLTPIHLSTQTLIQQGLWLWSQSPWCSPIEKLVENAAHAMDHECSLTCSSNLPIQIIYSICTEAQIHGFITLKSQWTLIYAGR